MRILTLLLQRTFILALGVFSVWLIVFVVFETADKRLPWMAASALTYGLSAYVILPQIVRMGLKVLRRKRVPSYTITGDGLPGDPVNLALIGTLDQLRSAFMQAGWSGADKLTPASALKMVRAFVLGTPYPTAPFSTLYLFGRSQDIGFQKAIGDSPRRRHHVRFWALRGEHHPAELGTADFWLNTDCPPLDKPVLWVGAATRDTGFSLTRLTFQITHATASDTDLERDFLIDDLKAHGVIAGEQIYQAEQSLAIGQVNHYITDGDVAVANLTTGE